MNNDELQQLREMCGQPRLSTEKIEQLTEASVDEGAIKELAEFYRNMGLPVTRTKLIELVEMKKSKCPCCGDAECKCDANCDKCDCNASDEDEECCGDCGKEPCACEEDEEGCSK